MAKYITKNQQIEDLKAQLTAVKAGEEETQQRLGDAIIAKCKLEAELASLGNNADEAQRIRLAAVTYSQDDPKSVSWDDIAQYLGQVRKDYDSLYNYACSIAKQNDLDPDLSVIELVKAFGEALTEGGNIRDKILEVGEKLGVEGNAMDTLEGIEEKIEAEGTGSDVRQEAIELLKDLGFDVTSLLPYDLYDSVVVPLTDSHVVYALRQQLPRISN